MKPIYLFALLLLFPLSLLANDGYKLWLQYYPLGSSQIQYQQNLGNVHFGDRSATYDLIEKEIKMAYSGFFEIPYPKANSLSLNQPQLFIALPEQSDFVRKHVSREEQDKLGEEGFLIKALEEEGAVKILVTGNSERALLYGTFDLLQKIQSGAEIPAMGLVSVPKIKHRVLNHWDNLDRTVERGYAGFSIWNWHRLPRHIDQQYHDYARANASIGINGTAITNVNANALVLTADYLEKAAALADVFRPYGIQIYLTARFSSPMEIGGLSTADPLDPDVQAWWKEKTKEIYEHIPDFGGFLVKADSEGQPGPHNYGRTQAEGANLLADAVKPFGGIVMWRAFVYSEKTPDDRHKQAYNEFKPIDGKFRDNVIVQVKNGAIDFQPREPFHPLFGAMPETPLMMEFQITQEYLGHDTHLAFLAPMYEEVLQSDTYVKGPGSTVSKVIDGSLHRYAFTGMAGVSNIGTDRNWTGHHFHQANWYAFGKLAWNPNTSSDSIASAWLKLTFTSDPDFVEPVKQMMLNSHEMVVNYMTPLGLHHIMARSHHYGPGPWVTGGSRADWTATYYHKANEQGVGFDRTSTGSNALEQYAEDLQKKWGDAGKIPEKYLLWFHHLPWDYRLDDGNSLWDGIALRYQKGVDEARQNLRTWESMKPYVDEERYAHVLSFLNIQAEEAIWWRDACLLYFGQFSNMSLPKGVDQPAHDLEHYMKLDPKFVPGI